MKYENVKIILVFLTVLGVAVLVGFAFPDMLGQRRQISSLQALIDEIARLDLQMAEQIAEYDGSLYRFEDGDWKRLCPCEEVNNGSSVWIDNNEIFVTNQEYIDRGEVK